CPRPSVSMTAPSIDCGPMNAEPPNIEPGQALERLDGLAQEAERALLDASSPAEVEELRARYLGREGELTQIVRSLPNLPSEERAEVGKRGNQAQRSLQALVEERA